MTALGAIADQINALPRPAHGSLRVFGDWFGKPYDNDHHVRSATAESDRLVLEFDDDETLNIWAPSGVEVSSEEFRVARADRVRWEWFYYGREKLPANRFAIEHVIEGSAVKASTTADWFEPRFQPSTEQPAVELLNVSPAAGESASDRDQDGFAAR